MQQLRHLLCLLGLGGAALWPSAPSLAQSVALAGMVGGKPLLVINGSSPKAVGLGDSYQGVRVLGVAGDRATLQSEGKRFSLRVGEAPVNAGSIPAASATPGQDSGRRIVLSQISGGHFASSGFINDRSVQFLVDTGATSVAMGVSDAERLGLNYKSGQPIQTGTANGVARGWRVRLNSVRIGNVQVYGVEAVVLQSSMPMVLLGNSFLNRFTMTRNGEQMVLERRY